MKTFPSSSLARGRASVRLRRALLALFALVSVVASADDRQPERRELWVPTKDMHDVLKDHPNAIMLDRAQYEALVRDAGKVKPDEKDQPPGGIAIESVKVSAKVADGASSTRLMIEIAYTSFVDQWAAANLGTSWFVLSDAALDNDSLVAWTLADGKKTDKPVTNTDKRDLVIMTKKKGHHVARLSVESPLLWTAKEGEMKLPTYGWHRELLAEIELPGAATLQMPSSAVRSAPQTFRFLAPSQLGSVRWNRKGDVATTADWALRQALVRCEATDEGVSSRVHLGLSSERESLPPQFVLVMPADGMNVVSVDSLAVGQWHQEGRRVVLDLDRSWGWHFGLDLRIEQSWSDTASGSSLSLPVPVVEGNNDRPATRVLVYQKGGHRLADLSGQGLTSLMLDGWGADYTLGKLHWRPSKKEFPDLGSDMTLARGASFAALPPDARMIFRRVGDQFSADVDNLVSISTHEMTLDRVAAIHGEEGSVNRVTLTLPANEQFLSLGVVNGEPLDWKEVQGEKGATKLELTWPKTLRKGQTSTLALRTRQDIATAGGAAQKLSIENVVLQEASRVAGYVALDFDESWKVATPGTTGLESRDARVTPVKGRMAWFNLRDYKLDLEIARNEPVLDGGVLAYALPRAKQVEIEGQFSLVVSRAPLRRFDVKLPIAAAKLLRVESPLIGQQQLDEATGIWHLTLRKELLGHADIRFHLSLPATVEQGISAKLSAALPRLELPTARRFTGQWVIEANTDTELSYETKGVQPMDTAHVGRVQGYQPRHRVLAAYGYGASDHSVKITATRHEAGELVSAVVDKMELASVLSRDGTSRHTAKLSVRHNGQQFVALKLPQKAQLLSAKVGTETVKPVQAGEDEVRVPLPPNASSTAAVEVIYELKCESWNSSGQHRLEPPSVGESVPVLSSSWRVYAPQGYEIANDIEGLSNLTTRRTPDLVGLLAGRFSKPGYVCLGRIMAGVGTGSRSHAEVIENTASTDFLETQVVILEGSALRERALQRIRSLHPELEDKEVEIRATPNPQSGIVNVAAVCDDKTYGRLYLDALLDEFIGFHKEQADREGKDHPGFNSESFAIMERPRAATVADEAEMVDFTPKYPKPMFVGTPVPIKAAATPMPAPTAAVAPPIQANDAPFAAAAPPYPGYYNQQKMEHIILPSVKFQGASMEEALEFLRIKSRDLDSMERDPGRRGVNIYMGHSDVPSKAQITLDLKDVPMSEALRYVTELAGMKYMVTAEGVTVVPITETTTEQYKRTFKLPPEMLAKIKASSPEAWLKSNGVSFPQGASVVLDSATSQLVVGNTIPNLDTVEALIMGKEASGQQAGAAAPVAGAGPSLLPTDPFGDDDRRLSTKSGLLSLDLTVPSVGRLLTINGHQKPTALLLHYQLWERQIAWTVLRIVLGVALFCWLGRRRPWLLTVVVILLLTCLPVWLAPSWLAFANALLAGWVLGFLFHLCRGLAHWLEKRFPLHLNFEAKGETV